MFVSFWKWFKSYLAAQYVRKLNAKIYYSRLIKASLLISIVPIVVLTILVIYERLSMLEGVLGGIFVLYGSTFFAKPYMEDLSALTRYVKSLAFDRKTVAPPLSFLSSVEELSEAVQDLHASWEERKIKLESTLAEGQILFNTLPDILLMVDENLQVIRANNAAFIRFGRKVVKRKITETIKNDVLVQAVHAVMLEGKNKEFEMIIDDRNFNRDYLVNIVKFPIYSPGGLSTIIVMHDITDSRRNRQMLKNFVANASHEIRTPLTSIAGFIETLRSVASEDKEATQKFLGIMADQAQHLINLLNNLLSLSKIEMHEDNRPLGNVDVEAALRNAIDRNTWLAEEHHMKILLTIVGAIPVITGEAIEIGQIFDNLISNAIKYGKSRTNIHITMRLIDQEADDRPALKGAKKVIAVEIKNYGEGIEKKQLSRITERFYRINKIRTKGISGSGLGLSIVKHALQHHQGDLLVESKAGKWSIFTVRLPAESK